MVSALAAPWSTCCKGTVWYCEVNGVVKWCLHNPPSHTVIMAPYLQGSTILETFTQYMMPPAHHHCLQVGFLKLRVWKCLSEDSKVRKSGVCCFSGHIVGLLGLGITAISDSLSRLWAVKTFSFHPHTSVCVEFFECCQIISPHLLVAYTHVGLSYITSLNNVNAPWVHRSARHIYICCQIVTWHTPHAKWKTNQWYQTRSGQITWIIENIENSRKEKYWMQSFFYFLAKLIKTK